MSRIGRKPIPIPRGVNVEINNNQVKVRGVKGELITKLHEAISISIEQDNLVLKRANDDRVNKSLHGLWRALIANMVKGVSEGYQQKLEIVGVGYKAEPKGTGIKLTLGFSHPILFIPPVGIKIDVPQPTTILVSGIDKELVGQVAAKIRSFRKPEPYKGKGIRYENEYIRRKAGKAAVSAGSK